MDKFKYIRSPATIWNILATFDGELADSAELFNQGHGSVLHLWFCLTITSTHVMGSSPTARPSRDKALVSVIGNYLATSDVWYHIQKRIPDFNFWSGHGTPVGAFGG